MVDALVRGLVGIPARFGYGCALPGQALAYRATELKLARDAMQELIKFRHDPKHRFVSSYIDNAIVEQYFIRNIEALFNNNLDN